MSCFCGRLVAVVCDSRWGWIEHKGRESACLRSSSYPCDNVRALPKKKETELGLETIDEAVTK